MLNEYPEYVEMRTTLAILSRVARFGITLDNIRAMDDYEKELLWIAAR